MGVALLMAGCSAENGSEEGVGTPIRLGYTVVTAEATRAATNLNEGHLKADDKVMVQVSTHDADSYSPYAFLVVDDAGQMVPASAPIPTYPDNGDHVDIVAYYPSTAETSFTVKADQTSDEAYKRSDLMYAATADYARGTDVSVTVPLLFTHKLAKLTVIVKVDENISPITNVSIISGSRTIDITDGTTCTLGTTLSDAVSAEAPLTLYNNETGAASLSCAAVMPPQEIAGNFIKVTTATDGSTVYSTTKALLSGHNYTIVLNVSKAVLAHTFNGIRNWSEPTETFEDPGAVLHF